MDAVVCGEKVDHHCGAPVSVEVDTFTVDNVRIAHCTWTCMHRGYHVGCWIEVVKEKSDG